MGTVITDGDDLARRAIRLMKQDHRVVLGITGSPGTGKTTITRQLVARINERLDRTGEQDPVAVYLPMDGYHLANSTLDRLGVHDRKGAIDTFDGWGFVALLHRLVDETDHTVYAPGFDKNVDEGIAGEIVIPPSARLVVTEGNDIRGLLAEVWFCETPDAERLRRLVDRHERHGRSRAAAEAWAKKVDGSNAVLIEQSRSRADLTISGALRL